jgi:hypothetical protein
MVPVGLEALILTTFALAIGLLSIWSTLGSGRAIRDRKAQEIASTDLPIHFACRPATSCTFDTGRVLDIRSTHALELAKLVCTPWN